MAKVSLRAGFDNYTGYGRVAQAFVEGFRKAGVEVELVSSRWDFRKEGSFGERGEAPECLKGLEIVDEPSQEWELRLAPPMHEIPFGDRAVVYFTMWESTRLSEVAVANMNASSQILVPCAWNATVFSASGVEKPIHVVPLGIDVGIFREGPMEMGGPCVFGSAGRGQGGGYRKGISELVPIFKRAFPTEEDVRLDLKVFPDCEILEFGDPRVRVIRDFYSDQQFAGWLSGLTAYASASRAEGWGLIPHQAMATGRPVIQAKWSGVEEIFDPSVGYPVKFDMGYAEGLYEGTWAEVDPKDMEEKMRRVYLCREEARGLGRRAAIRARRFSWDRSTDELILKLRELRFI